jgi:hypothetical protein
MHIFQVSLSVADPGSSAFRTPGYGIGKKHVLDPGSGMNIKDHLSESLETVFNLKNI